MVYLGVVVEMNDEAKIVYFTPEPVLAANGTVAKQIILTAAVREDTDLDPVNLTVKLLSFS